MEKETQRQKGEEVNEEEENGERERGGRRERMVSDVALLPVCCGLV